MRVALAEAERSVGQTSPNPAVGAVIVRDGQIIARGWHQFAGAPHAEVEAISALQRSEDARGAALYVTLEPCSTHGRTPPCTEAILNAGFWRVVIGAMDPNPLHAGRAGTLLRDAGLEVRDGVLADECTALNRGFNKWIVSGIPWVIAKAGMSLDGRLSRPPGEGQWITNEQSRAEAHRLRARVDAILIGANTLRADNPRLTIRGVDVGVKQQPWRVVLTHGQTPLPREAHLFTDEHRERTLVFTGETMESVLAELGRREVTSVLIEGGMRVLGDAFDRRLVDEVQFFIAPLLCGGPAMVVGGRGAESTAASVRIKDPAYRELGGDLQVSGLTEYPPA